MLILLLFLGKEISTILLKYYIKIEDLHGKSVVIFKLLGCLNKLLFSSFSFSIDLSCNGIILISEILDIFFIKIKPFLFN